MKVHVLMNDPMAHLGTIQQWIDEKSYELSLTRVYESTNFPNLDAFDLLIILGGSMGAYEEDQYPWLKDEKKFITKAIQQNKVILGICLGSQLIAEVIGGKVYRHIHDEIGWWDVHFTKSTQQTDLFKDLPKSLTFFQYHGDTFDLPDSAVRIATNEAAKNQGFVYKDQVVGLQFHPEFSQNQLQNIVQKYDAQMKEGRYVQHPDEYFSDHTKFLKAKKFLFTLLDRLSEMAQTKDS